MSKVELVNILNYYDLKLDNVHLSFDNINNLWNENSTQRNNHIDIIKKWLKYSGAEWHNHRCTERFVNSEILNVIKKR